MRTIRATRPEIPSYEDYIKEISSVWDEGALTNNGPKVQRYRSQLADHLGTDNVDVFVNGHSALVTAIKAMDLPEGGEVLTSPFTFVSTTNAIIQCGLTPVFCDIGENYNISLSSIERNLTDKSCAIITPHIFGIPCDVKAIDEIAQKHGLKVIYDAAQAFGTKIGGKSICQFGDATMFSTHAIKVFNSIEGGILVYKDEKVRDFINLFRNFGISYEDGGDVRICGINAKMNEFQAAMGLLNLVNTDRIIEKRKTLADHYIERLSEIDGITPYAYKEGISYNYAYFPVKIDPSVLGISREELFEGLKDRGIGTRKLYNVLTCDFSFYKNKGFRRDTEYAQKVTGICLDLPMYSDLTFDDIDYICEMIKECGKGGN
ncbi:MAG: DegT/DnrJ/EryC1/StrS family aminotransferase [Lachnospiraceae bacterium]|nr:DegT/DnrJ/EryC1/StrS family aminotransferase [Lachnospiraceae bacterium]